MKTVMIFDQFGQEPLQFITFDGDLSHLDGTLINSVESEESKQDELSDMLYDKDTGDTLYKDCASEKFPVQDVKDGAIVIVCGFLP